MASRRPIFHTTTRSPIAESASLLRRPMPGLAMTRTPKLGTTVARLASNMSRALLSGTAGIVEAAPVLITESYCGLPECRHSRTRRNSWRESWWRELSGATVLVYVWQT